MKNVLISIVLVGMLFASGCCSMMSYSGAKEDYVVRVNAQRAAAANNGVVGVSVNLLDPDFWAVLKEHPIRETVCLVADTALAAGATWAITSSVDNSHHDSNTITVNGNNNTTSYNNGQGNNINNNPSTTTTTGE